MIVHIRHYLKEYGEHSHSADALSFINMGKILTVSLPLTTERIHTITHTPKIVSVHELRVNA